MHFECIWGKAKWFSNWETKSSAHFECIWGKSWPSPSVFFFFKLGSQGLVKLVGWERVGRPIGSDSLQLAPSLTYHCPRKVIDALPSLGKTLPQVKRHKPSLLFASLTICTSLTLIRDNFFSLENFMSIDNLFSMDNFFPVDRFLDALASLESTQVNEWVSRNFAKVTMHSWGWWNWWYLMTELQKRANRANLLVLIFTGRCYFLGKARKKLCHYLHYS